MNELAHQQHDRAFRAPRFTSSVSARAFFRFSMWKYLNNDTPGRRGREGEDGKVRTGRRGRWAESFETKDTEIENWCSFSKPFDVMKHKKNAIALEISMHPLMHWPFFYRPKFNEFSCNLINSSCSSWKKIKSPCNQQHMCTWSNRIDCRSQQAKAQRHLCYLCHYQ